MGHGLSVASAACVTKRSCATSTAWHHIYAPVGVMLHGILRRCAYAFCSKVALTYKRSNSFE